MAVKGKIAKEEITNKILEVFEGAFINGKELRIPYNENGENIEIKVALTCAKENVAGGTPRESNDEPFVDLPWTGNAAEPTEEEKQRISDLLAML